ncbi:MAG: transcription-repair coupling factor [Acidobacteria bacterium]|nr:transcription-repair coupling factor [Acidobacteriota bacterium]MCB9398194.1 transcription-repair coupling factor [Acidobacteriota bacterium]
MSLLDSATQIHGLRGSALAFWLAQRTQPIVVVLEQAGQIDGFAQDLATFAPHKTLIKLPPRSGSPFLHTHIHDQIRLQRIQSFFALQGQDWDVLVTSVQCLLERLPPTHRLAMPHFRLSCGEELDLEKACRQLADMGYRRGDLVSEPGEFARRGGILDVFPLDADRPVRIEVEFDTIEDLRSFDAHSQRSISPIDDLDILPVREWVAGPEEIAHFAKAGGKLWNKTKSRQHFLELYARADQSGHFPGIEHWTALFFDQTQALFDLAKSAEWLFEDGDACLAQLDSLISNWQQQQEEAEHAGQIFAPLSQITHVDAQNRLMAPHRPVLVHYHLQPDRLDQSFLTRAAGQYLDDFPRFLRDWSPQLHQMAIVFALQTQAGMHQAEHLAESAGIPIKEIRFPLPAELPPGFYFAEGSLSTGFEWPDHHLLVMAESDIWPKQKGGRRKALGKKVFFSELADLKPGDFVVHKEHGIGQFLGLVDVRAGDHLFEMMALEYKGQDKLYVALDQLDQIQRLGPRDSTVHVDQLGGVSWARTKERVRKAIRELAIDLLKLYAERELIRGLTCEPDNELQWEFEQDFPFDATPDQLKACEEIKADIQQNGPPMDRVLVGDVGFGKTEVAMRFAYKLVQAGGQVAVLCPTTVLAFQHFLTFRQRFAKTPARIGWVSRFSSTSELKKLKEQVQMGELDIVIGTHRLLGKDIQFRNLAGLVIDEEQRFGVAHKEKLKETRKQVHVLSMSATPIPRTLNMAFSGMRQISVMETPPRNRMAISTNIIEFRPGLIRNAIQFELARKGQVFFIHNRVETMPEMVAELAQLVPEARIDFAHGQMDSQPLESVMVRFIKGEFDVLVASAIIENGVDIPNANTMIVNQAHMFGLGQLYQLRGRIGRSDRPAYAFLVVPPRGRMNPQARKRLAALEEFSELGAGFRIAARDMEVRGVGDLLGARQSGFVEAVGFQTYMRLLEETIAELRGQKIEDVIHCVLNLKLGAAIPKAFVESTAQRLHYYQKFARAQTKIEAEEIYTEMRDCFGQLPPAVDQLLRETQIKILAQNKRITSLDRDGSLVRMRFHPDAPLRVDQILNLIQSNPKGKITPEGILQLAGPNPADPHSYYTWLETVLQEGIHLDTEPGAQARP